MARWRRSMSALQSQAKIAFVSHSDFGSLDTDSSRKMRRATALLKQNHPEIEADGEMQGDTGCRKRPGS